jgi:hypothetical protein
MNARSSKLAALAAVSTAALALAACGEIPQDGPKPFAGPEETRSYAGEPFAGDRALYERNLVERTRTQDEYFTMDNRNEEETRQVAVRARLP